MTDHPDTAAFSALRARAEAEAGSRYAAECARLLNLARQDGTAAQEALASVLVAAGQPLWAVEVAAFALGCAGDRRAFEPLVFLLNHRDGVRGVTAAHALARLADPRTARAAAALAGNELRTAYAEPAVRLLAALSAPESVPTLIAVLERLLRQDGAGHPDVALACVEGLGALADARARPVLVRAAERRRLGPAAAAALVRVGD